MTDRKFQAKEGDVKKLIKTMACFSIAFLLVSCLSEKAVRYSIHDEAGDQAYFDGIKIARIDVSNGVYRIKKKGMPQYSDYELLLRRKYGIKTDVICGYFISPPMDSFIRGYNQISKDAIEQKYGHDFWEKTAKEAENIQEALAGLEGEDIGDYELYSTAGRIVYRISMPEKDSKAECRIKVSRGEKDFYRVDLAVVVKTRQKDSGGNEGTMESKTTLSIIAGEDKWADLDIGGGEKKLETVVNIGNEELHIKHGAGFHIKIKVTGKAENEVKASGVVICAKQEEDGKVKTDVFPLEADCELGREKTFYFPEMKKELREEAKRK